MQTTDYSKIAHKYDRNPYRVKEIKYDHDLESYINNTAKSSYKVLDLSCGTGLYLAKQINYFDGYNIIWHGLDLSDQMLKKAEERLDSVNLVKADVSNMLYDKETFDFISNNYAFHHYSNKEQALDEINRILVKGGTYKLHNIAIHEMSKWWVYHYFPTAYYEDLKRFWPRDVLFNELIARGFKVSLTIDYRMEEAKVSDLLNYAENRDISVLTLIDDKDFNEGLDKMRRDVEGDSNKKVTCDFAELFCIAIKK